MLWVGLEGKQAVEPLVETSLRAGALFDGGNNREGDVVEINGSIGLAFRGSGSIATDVVVSDEHCLAGTLGRAGEKIAEVGHPSAREENESVVSAGLQPSGVGLARAKRVHSRREPPVRKSFLDIAFLCCCSARVFWAAMTCSTCRVVESGGSNKLNPPSLTPMHSDPLVCTWSFQLPQWPDRHSNACPAAATTRIRTPTIRTHRLDTHGG
ncbi:hypothetical protein ACW9HQ_29395 [Nocardia gipuzkoensis]